MSRGITAYEWEESEYYMSGAIEYGNQVMKLSSLYDVLQVTVSI